MKLNACTGHHEILNDFWNKHDYVLNNIDSIRQRDVEIGLQLLICSIRQHVKYCH